MRLRILDLLKPERGITSGPYSGYFWWTIIGMSILTVITILSNNATYFDTVQQIIIFGSLAISYDFFSGFTGYYNLGFGAFAAVGAYVFAFTSNGGLNVFPALLLAGVVSAILAAGMSYPFLRLRGAYYAIGTLALVLLLYYLDINLPEYTRGLIGLYVGISQTNIKLPLILGSLAFLLLTLWIHHIISRSRIGLALKSIREEEDVSESFGVNAFRMKQIAMILSGFFGGVSGGIFAMYLGFINADNMLGLSVALFPVVSAMAGGTGIFLGPLAGSFLLTGVNLTLPSFIITINPSIIVGPLAITGLILLLVGLLFPAGLLRIGFLRKYAYSRPDRILINMVRRSNPPVASQHKSKDAVEMKS